MEEIKDFIIEYVEENEVGNINDIIKFVLKRNVELKENLSKLQESIELILKSLNFVRFSEVTKKFYLIAEQVQLENKFFSYKNHIIGDILKNDKGEIDFKGFFEFFYNNVRHLGKLTRTNSEIKENINGLFDTDIIQVFFSIDQKRIHITSMMKPSFESPQPLFNYLANISNESIKKDRSVYIPLNYGLYLVYKDFIDYLKDFHPKLNVQVYDIEFFY